MKFNKKYLYFLIFFNCFVIVLFTIYSLSNSNWSIFKPKRIASNDSYTLPDLNKIKDCERFNGKISIGLFKSILLLNHGYGCRHEIFPSKLSRTQVIRLLILLLYI
jgi:hypothetical protein